MVLQKEKKKYISGLTIFCIFNQLTMLWIKIQQFPQNIPVNKYVVLYGKNFNKFLPK